MKFTFMKSWGLVVCFLIACIPLLAHHGDDNYDTSKPVILKGATVTNFYWTNPHVILMVDAKDDEGNVQHWSVEASNPSTLQLKNWTQTSFQKGDTVTVYVFQAKTHRPVGRLNKAILANGTTLTDGQQGAKEY
jgi:hypothetical protein